MLKAVAVVFLIFIVSYTANVIGLLHPLNGVFRQQPDNSCSADGDCTLRILPEWSECTICENCRSLNATDPVGVVALNKGWRAFCPFEKPGASLCQMCTSTISGAGGVQVQCVQKVCRKTVK